MSNAVIAGVVVVGGAAVLLSTLSPGIIGTPAPKTANEKLDELFGPVGKPQQVHPVDDAVADRARGKDPNWPKRGPLREVVNKNNQKFVVPTQQFLAETAIRNAPGRGKTARFDQRRLINVPIDPPAGTITKKERAFLHAQWLEQGLLGYVVPAKGAAHVIPDPAAYNEPNKRSRKNMAKHKRVPKKRKTLAASLLGPPRYQAHYPALTPLDLINNKKAEEERVFRIREGMRRRGELGPPPAKFVPHVPVPVHLG